MSNETITIIIRMSTAARFTIGAANLDGSNSNGTGITPANTILEIKEIISNMGESGNCPVDRQRLIHKGRILSENLKTLREYDIVDSEQVIFLVKGKAQTGTSTGIGAPTATPTANTNVNMNNTQITPATGASPPANPFAAFQNSFMNQNGNQQLPGNMAQMQNDLMNNPEQLSSMMNSPMMQSIMSNPDIMRSMMESNPQMRQLLESNPELRHMLDDPELMRRSMEMMRDPSAMQNMMRNQDLAMSQIENIPGGFSALRRMYEDVQAPMMDAMAGGGNNASNGTNHSPGLQNERSGAGGTAMPNPWATNTNQNTNASGSGTTPASTPGGGNANSFGGSPNPWTAGNAAGASNGTGMPNVNIEQTIQMLENPMMNQMMNSFMSDPAAMESIMNSNPVLRQMRETNPQVAAMLSNPEMMRSMMNPNNLRSMMEMQTAMQQMGQTLPGLNFPGTMPGMSGVDNNMNSNPGAPGLDFSSLLNQMQSTSIGAGIGSSTSTNTGRVQNEAIPDEQRYSIQLQSLNDMGFDDNLVNIMALAQTHGNVNRAIDMLLTNPPTPVQNASPAPTTNSVHESATGNEDTFEDKDSKDKKDD